MRNNKMKASRDYWKTPVSYSLLPVVRKLYVITLKNTLNE